MGGHDEQRNRGPDVVRFLRHLLRHLPGKLLVLWRPKPEKERAAEDEERKRGPREFKVVKNSTRGGQRPEVKHVTVLGNQRLTQQGKVKKAKPKQRSIKKRTLD